MKKMFRTLLMAGVLATGAVACGSDEDDDSPTEESTSGTAGEEGGSDNADVQAYCDQAEEFVAEAEDIDFSSGEAADLVQEAQELAARAAELTSANADDAEAIAACNQRIADAMTP